MFETTEGGPPRGPERDAPAPDEDAPHGPGGVGGQGGEGEGAAAGTQPIEQEGEPGKTTHPAPPDEVDESGGDEEQ